MAEAYSGALASTAAVHVAPLRSVRIVECGSVVQRALDEGSTGVAYAVFRRSAYLECAGRGLICIGDAELGRGPLNARVQGFAPPRIGETLAVIAQSASVWRPLCLVGRPVGAAVRALGAAAAQALPQEGLGGTIAGLSTPLIAHARPAIDALGRWLIGAPLTRDVEALLGLGPGLTPSGDDYLGGAMIALHAFGHARDAAALWARLAPRAWERTNRISAAHLFAAAEGEGQQALHAILEALVEGETRDWRERLVPLASMGHCSGWDGLAGVMAVARQLAE